MTLADWLNEAPPSLVTSDPPTSPISSPCPEIEARAADVASVRAWEVEPESGPLSRRADDALGLDLDLIVYAREP